MNSAVAGKICNPPSPPFGKPKVTLWSGGKVGGGPLARGFETYFLNQYFNLLPAHCTVWS